MTIEEKLELFYEAAIEDATSQSSTIIDEYKQSLDENLKVFKENVMNKSEVLIQSEKED